MEACVSADVKPLWAKVFVDGELKHPDYPFSLQLQPMPGMTFHTTSEPDVFEIMRVEPDQDFPGRVIVHARRI
jgi:hypothetical protein